MKNVTERGGKKLHTGMLEEAEKAIAGKGDGRISEADAKQILTHLDNDPQGVGNATVEYLKENYKLTSGGKKVLDSPINPPPQTPFHILPETRPDFAGRNTPAAILVDDQLNFITMASGSKYVFIRIWSFLIKPPVMSIAPIYISRDGSSGVSAAYMPNNGKEDAYIFTTFTTNSDEIVVGRYFLKNPLDFKIEGLNYKDKITAPKQSNALGAVKCIPIGNIIYLAWRDKANNAINLGQLDYHYNDKLDANPVYTPLMSIPDTGGYKQAPAIVSCVRENVEKENQQLIMIYYNSPNTDTDKSNLNVASYNRSTGEPSIIGTYSLEGEMKNEIAARNMTSSKIQLVCIDGSKSLDVIEIEHGEVPQYKQAVVNDLNESFKENGSGSFLRVGRSDYLVYFDKNDNINYYLMPDNLIK